MLLRTAFTGPAVRAAACRLGARTPLRCQAMSSAAAPPAPPKFMLLEYAYVSDIIEKRGPYRAAHLAAAQKMANAGKMVLAGAKGDPVEGALFIWTPEATKEEIETFVANDPYVMAGLVPSWSLKPYAVVVQPSTAKQ